jgi:hypothetical protein
MSASREHLRTAAQHLRSAAETAAEQVVPPGVRAPLRSAAREALLAGVAAINAAEERARARTTPAAPAAPAAPATPPAGT